MISSRQNAWVKDIRRLRRSKGARRRPATDGRSRQRLLLEGPHLVSEAAEMVASGRSTEAAGTPTLEVVLATPSFLDGPDAPPLLALLDRPPLVIAPSLLDELADADSPRGVIAVSSREATGLDDLPTPFEDGEILVYADGLADPGNLGALARVAEGAGATALVCSPGTVDPLHPRALRASAGSLLRLPTFEGLDFRSLDRWLGEQSRDSDSDAPPAAVTHGGGVRWWGLVPRAGSELWQTHFDGPRVLVVGAEAAGISPELEARLDGGLTIPMAGRVESLNATVAAAVVLFEWARQSAAADRARH